MILPIAVRQLNSIRFDKDTEDQESYGFTYVNSNRESLMVFEERIVIIDNNVKREVFYYDIIDLSISNKVKESRVDRRITISTKYGTFDFLCDTVKSDRYLDIFVLHNFLRRKMIMARL